MEGRSIVCFAHDWEGDPTSKTHIMRILARRNRVLWVNSIAMRRPTACRADLGRIAAKLRRSVAGCREVEPNLFVASPLALPMPGVPAADRFNAWLVGEWLRRLAGRLRLRDPILWTYLPTVVRLLGSLGERMVVYHCVDEYAAFTGVPREAIVRMERELVARADLVIVSSLKLREERVRINPNTHYVPHGVDVAHFARALDPDVTPPEEIASLPRPVIGFIGLLADWVDLRLVREIALARPDWSVALIGRPASDTRAVEGLPNVRLLGGRPYRDLPGCCRGIDVGIIPFRLNTLTLRANPLKLREYLAAGLPVVSTPLPEVERYGGLVRIARDASEFVAQIEAALTERGPLMVRHRRDAMAKESWETRVAEITRLLERCTGAAA